MPELPEVETIARGLRRPLIGRRIISARFDWPRQVVIPSAAELARRIPGRCITAVGRRGKYLIFSLDDGQSLVIHLKMTGQLGVYPAEAPADKHVHTALALEGGDELRFRDMRKFGRVYLVDDLTQVTGALGPEPLDKHFGAKKLADRLQGRTRQLKPLLLDQSFVAGVGNIYADEALFEAGLHPQRPANELSPAEIEALHSAIRYVLTTGILKQGASLDAVYRTPDGAMGQMQEAFKVYGRGDQPCYRCGTPIRRIILGQRSTHFCPGCQC
ncbi:MAG: bifunctional DNA-formamidopyrimidine glycosylase/DNA-(apurinic or apyrimidinic site) lyase [Candidatus Promineifilaceae bacterium]